MRRGLLLTAAVLVMSGCGDAKPATPASTMSPERSGRPGIVVAALGDSINAGSPIWDPDPAVRERIGNALDERSQWEYWYERSHRGLRLRNCGIFGQRTDQIAQRLDACTKGARAVVIQGGINDIAQGRPVADAGDDLLSMVRRAKQAGLRVALVEVLPWNNGYPRAAPLIDELNKRIRAIGRDEDVPVAPWYEALEDPAAPGRMKAELTIDGDHPSIAGYRILASRLRLP